MKIFGFHKRNVNRLKRKLNKLNKKLSKIDKMEKNALLFDKLYFINQNINNLINFIDMVNYDLQNNNLKNTKILNLIEKDKEAQEILDKFLPLMLYYQTIKQNS
jgi:hypothetical protein